MKRWGAEWVAGAALALVAASCATMPPPVPVIGATHDVAALAGTWSGEYWSPVTGRSGSITFTLAAEADTAFGEVLMLPSRQSHTTTPSGHGGPPSQMPRTLSIAFVRAAHDSVFGYLDPYEDAECECLLLTKFVGRLDGGAITGRYVTRNTRTSETTTGEWSVHRKPSSSTQEVFP